MMNGTKWTTQWVCHQPKHMETVTERISSQQQCAWWVKCHCSDWMTSGMSYKVSNQSNAIWVFLYHHLTNNIPSTSHVEKIILSALLLDSSFRLRGSTTSLCSSASFTSWRLQSGVLSSVPSSCINVLVGLHRRTSLTNFVKWQMLRLITGYILLPRLYHWSSGTFDCYNWQWAFPVATANIWNSLPKHVTSAPSMGIFQTHIKCQLFSISFPSTLPTHWHCVI